MLESLLGTIAQALDALGIPYMVIGGPAVLLHGEPRLTKDIDIALGVDLDVLVGIVEALPTMALAPLVNPEEFTRDTMVLPCRHAASGVRVDFIFSFTPYERVAIARSVTVVVANNQVRFASAEDLVIHKLVAGRPRDIDDARSILLKNPGLDRRMVREVLADFEPAVDQPVVARFNALVRDLEPPAQ